MSGYESTYESTMCRPKMYALKFTTISIFMNYSEKNNGILLQTCFSSPQNDSPATSPPKQMQTLFFHSIGRGYLNPYRPSSRVESPHVLKDRRHFLPWSTEHRSLKGHDPGPLIWEIFGHNRLRSWCLQVQPVTCGQPSGFPLLNWGIFYKLLYNDR